MNLMRGENVEGMGTARLGEYFGVAGGGTRIYADRFKKEMFWFSRVNKKDSPDTFNSQLQLIF